MTMAQRATARIERINAAEWLVWLTVLLTLAAGLILRGRVEARAVRFSQAGVSLVYPAGWTALADEEDYQILHAIDPASSVQFPTSVRLRRIPFGDLGRAASSLGDVALSWSARQGQELPVYSVLQIAPVAAHGRPAVLIDYAYVPQPALGVSAGSIPTVVRARDTLLQQGDTIVVLTFEASIASYSRAANRWENVLAALDVQ